MARKPLYGRLDFFDGAHLKILNHHVSTDKPSCFQISNPRPEKKVSVPSPLPWTELLPNQINCDGLNQSIHYVLIASLVRSSCC